MERHVWLRALAVSLAPPRSYRVSARMHRRNGLRAFRLHAIHDAPGHRGCVTNVISWGRNHRWPGIMSSSWSNVVYFPYSSCRVIKLIHLSQPLRSPSNYNYWNSKHFLLSFAKEKKNFPKFFVGYGSFSKKIRDKDSDPEFAASVAANSSGVLVDSRDRRRPGTRAGISISRRVRIQKWSVGRGYWKEVKNTNVRALAKSSTRPRNIRISIHPRRESKRIKGGSREIRWLRI